MLAVKWLTPQSEYRPTEYIQGWLSFWFDDNKRLSVAKQFQLTRLEFIFKVWKNDRDLKTEGFDVTAQDVSQALSGFEKKIPLVQKVGDLLLEEATVTRQLYKIAATRCDTPNFIRAPEQGDLANTFLNHGNYLAYGLAASTLWVLGIPHGFAVMHGKTRRGALVFDVADLIKDAIVLPWAFICAKEGMKEQEFRQQILQKFTEHNALDFMFDTVKKQALHPPSQNNEAAS